MQIDPKLSYWLNVILGILVAVSLGTISFSDFLDPITAKKLASAAAVAAFVLNIVLHGYSSPAAGPGIVLPPPSAKLTLALAVISLGLLALGAPAQAQSKPPKLPDPLHLLQGNPPSATPITTPLDFAAVGVELQKAAKDLVDKGIADLTAASTDAKNRGDKIAQPCWDAQVAFLQLLPVEWPTPPAEVGPALAIQIGRDLGNAINGNADGSLKVACAALLGDTLSIVNNVLAVVGLKAGLAAVGIP